MISVDPASALARARLRQLTGAHAALRQSESCTLFATIEIATPTVRRSLNALNP
jgi:hypothetical protein